ncbi:hypothetical protein ACFFV7_08035 [Nonomuraea spiralis]|uniref:Uncharacterized protein n=1 Tax=Nonomuraea spiralis TaxID=46182 RepID=A0ABV5I9B6_9ACTN|nr:hypothetical protein [Nonomuraea spiralis]GGS77144.1 hypothetical protein GCM10010176_020420 [Nonomuraea spiralis]
METLTYRGEKANLQVLAEEIAADPVLKQHCVSEIQITDAAEQGSLRYGAWAEITVAIASGVATNAIYDGLRYLVSRARDRGVVTEVDPQSGDDGPTGTDASRE